MAGYDESGDIFVFCKIDLCSCLHFWFMYLFIKCKTGDNLINRIAGMSSKPATLSPPLK